MPPSSASLVRLKTHYFAIFAVFGCLSAYLPVYLRDVKGLSPADIGLIFAVGQSGVLFLPALMTLLADRYRIVGPLLAALSTLVLAAMVGLSMAVGFAACLVFVFLNQLATQPQLALSDGIFFSLQSDPAQPRAPYSAVRVWGTIGFIVPSTLIFFLYDFGGLRIVPFATMTAALIGILNATGFPRRLSPLKEKPRRLPTLEAARLFCRPPVALFCCGVGVLYAANTAYYAFYPLYLTQQVGIDSRWVGLIINIGVCVEVGYMLMFERMQAHIGLHGVIVVGSIAALVRAACLAFVPVASFAIGFQIFHGLTVIGIQIVPIMYLNSLVVSESYRNSVQGLYVMLVAGVFSIAGNYLSGQLAQTGLLLLFRVGFAATAVGLAMIVVSLIWKKRSE